MPDCDREPTLPGPGRGEPAGPGRVGPTPEELEQVTRWQVWASVPVADGDRTRSGFACFGITATGPDAARRKAEAILGATMPVPGEAQVLPILPPHLRTGWDVRCGDV